MAVSCKVRVKQLGLLGAVVVLVELGGVMNVQRNVMQNAVESACKCA